MVALCDFKNYGVNLKAISTIKTLPVSDRIAKAVWTGQCLTI